MAKKNNTKIYERFRAACDALFLAKSEFYKNAKDKLSANLKAKKELIAQAEELKDNKNWKSTTEKFIALQKQWKKIGPVPNKISEQIREVIVNKQNTSICPETEALLFAAARAQLMNEIIFPSLESEKTIIFDRFVDSSIVYQGFARNLGMNEIVEINKLF